MWLYVQSTGKYFAPNGLPLARGYSGHGVGKNNPAMQALKNVGPIPCGLWRMTELRLTTEKHGPYVIVLEPEPGTETFGRTDFREHGGKAHDPEETASEGCIVLPRFARERSWESPDHLVQVVP